MAVEMGTADRPCCVGVSVWNRRGWKDCWKMRSAGAQAAADAREGRGDCERNLYSKPLGATIGACALWPERSG